MRTASATPIFLLAACARLTGEPAPQPRSVTPAGAYRGEPAVVRIQGTGFSVRGVQHLGGEGRVESNFTVRIGGRALPAALVTDGTGEQELEVTVPADLPPGLHDVEVVDPYGTSAVLHGGFVESVGPPPSLSVRVDGPARSETGAPVDVVVTVDNGGGETATAVAVSFEAQTLAGGASVRPGDRLSLNVALPDPGLGPHEFVVAVSGTDGVTGLPLEAVTALARVDFVSPPTLRAVTYPPPAAVDVSQPFELRVDLTNDGDVDALAVQVVLDPDAALTAISPEPQDVPAGTTRTFILGARGTLPGIAAPRARALGSDALTSNPMPPLEALWPGIEVQMPAALRVAAITAPGAVSVGQEFEVEALVANDGDAAALDVQDLSAAAANVAIVSAPPQQQVAGHAVASFRWRLRADAAGTGTLVVSLSGADANSGWAAAATALAPLLVQAPASLSVDSVSMPSSLSRGQAFTLTAVIRNQGGASAVSLQRSYSVASAGGAAASCTPVAGPTALAGGSAGTFTWWCIENGTAAGALTVSVAASAVDANSLVAISAAPLPGTPATVQRPAALEIASVVLPAALSRGQSFTLVATLSNTGEAAATGVQFSAPQTVATGGANAACTPSSASSSVAGATSVAFSWSCQESGANSGTLSFTVHVTAADVNSGAAVSAAAGSAAAAVQQPASLAVSSLVAPSRLSRGQTWTAELTVRNAGEASARAVTPDLASAVSGGAGVSVVAAPAVQDVPGGESAIFSWTLRESGTSTGSITLDAGVSGVDENGGASLSARAGTPAIPVQQPASVSIDGVSLPLLLSRGQSFPVTAVVRNDGGARVVSMQVPASAVAVGGAAASCTAQVAPVSIAGGTSATYSWACRENGTSTGSLAFSVSAIGLDENSSAALSSGPVSSGTATVEQPAVLAASLATGPSLSRGQAFTVVSTVTNAGDARAIGVQPGPLAIAGAGGANAICIPNWTSSSIDGGTVATFAWNCLESGSGSGTLTFEAQLTGMDENSGAALTASTAPFTSAVQQPAALRISSVSAPTALSRGQGFTISVTVSNEGEALAEAVGAAALATTANGGPAVLVLASPGTQDIVGGASATYSWSSRENGAGPGTLQLTASFSGADGNSGAAVSVTATTSLIAVQTPAALTIDSVSLPSPLSQGQPFTLAAEITNSGGAAAVGLKAAPPVVSASGGAAATCVPQSAPSSIPGGASATFSWSCDENGASTGALAFAVSASGADGNSAAPIAAGPVSSPTVSVQAPADLSISSWTVPAVLSRGQTFTVMAGVSNNAEATARSVEPGTLMIIATGGANATCTASFVPTDLAGGGTASFSWNCAETGMSSGTLAFAVQASGTDANSGSLVTSPLSTSTTHAVQEPAALSVASFMLPSALSSGQTFTVTLVLANTGQANARAVLPSALSPTTTGAAALAVSSAPAAQDVAGGQSVTFTWTCRESGTGPGTLQIAATASGTDANSGAIVGAGGSTPAATVQTAAGLAIESIAVPAAITRGQTFEIVATVRNSGGATARSVTPSQPTVVATGAAAATTTSTQAPADIAGGASATFTWRYRESGSGSGTLAFGVAASGTDANSGTTTVARAVTSSAFPVQQPPLLSISAFTAQSSLGSTTVNTGQSFTLTMTLANGGEAPAAGVLANPHPPSQTATGGAQATVTALPDPIALAGGAAGSLTYGYVAGPAPGMIALSAGASGSDANSGAALSAPARSASLTVQQPAALSSTIAAPASLSVGDRAAISLVVTNTGGATIGSVAPAPLILGGTAGASIVSGPTPSATTLAAGATAVFGWTLSMSGSGTLQITAAASGMDVNDAATRTTSTTISREVNTQPECVLLTAADPFGGDGTSFSYLFSYQDMVYLGPNRSGTGAVRMAPDGSNAIAINWQLEVNTTSQSPASNRAYQPPNPAICHTIGMPGCNTNSLTPPLCGPDNETGRASFASGFVNGTEWYLVSGASASSSFARYVYLTNGNFPLAPGGYDDLAWAQIQAGQTGGTRTTTVTGFLRNAVYLGFMTDASDTPPNAPVLNVLKTMPAAPAPGSTGFVAAANTDLIDLGGKFMPAIGGSGQPANLNVGSSAWLMVDAIGELGSVLYVANNGGIARSVPPDPPSPCLAKGCTNWTNTTPSAAAWSAKASPTIDRSILAALEPSQKAVPAIVHFGNRLFAARNTTSGPQLWSCNPATSNGGDLEQCERDEWTLVAPNSTGDPQLTQFNGANTAVTLLVATASHLYVGFNNASGVQIFRTGTAAAAVRSDFSGLQGCDASLSTCRGLGSDVFGPAITRIFDARAFTYSGTEWLYVSAGDGSGSPRIFRMAP